MALGMEAAINNAEEAAGNAPFNSTGLQTAGRLFFLGCRGATSGSSKQPHSLLWLCVCLHRQVFPSTSLQTGEPLRCFHRGGGGISPNGVSNFPSSQIHQQELKRKPKRCSHASEKINSGGATARAQPHSVFPKCDCYGWKYGINIFMS